MWADVEITYDSTVVRFTGDCFFCDAAYAPASDSALLRIQHEDRYIVWSIHLAGPLSTGARSLSADPDAGVHVAIAEQNRDLPARLLGQYATTGGTVTLSQADLRRGGVVAGTLSAVLEGGSDVTPVQATLVGEFHAGFPP